MTVRKIIRGGRPFLVIDIPYLDTTGKRQRYRRDAQVQTMTAARAEERRLLLSLSSGEFMPRKRTEKVVTHSFGDAIEVFRAVGLVALKPSTQRTYSEILRALEPFEEVELGKMDAARLQRIDVDLIKAGASPSRRRNFQIVVRSIFKTAVVQGLVAAPPKFPSLPRVGKTKTLVMSRLEVEALLSKIEGGFRVACALAAYAGLRLGEVRGLRWSDVDLSKGYLTIRRSIVGSKKAPLITTPKSGHERTVPIAGPLRAILEAAPKTDIGPVTCAADGKIWGERSVTMHYQRVCKSLGLQGKRRFHSLRHFFVSELFRLGADAKSIQDLAGHLHLSTTQIYASADEAARVAAIARFG